jgi:voltage-gated sodium channel
MAADWMAEHDGMMKPQSVAHDNVGIARFRSGGRSMSSDMIRRTEALERRMKRLSAEDRTLRRCIYQSIRSTSFSQTKHSWQQKMKTVVHSQMFEVCSGLVIILNAATVGMEQSFKRSGIDTSMIDAVEHVFLCVYIVELGMRFFAVGKAMFSDRWTRFDIFLVGAGVISGWIVEPIVVHSNTQDTGTFAVLRTTRLLRLARTLRLLVTFKDLWLLVRGLMSSIHTMMYTTLLVGIVIYVFSCLSMILVTNNPNNMHNPYYRKAVEDNFDNLGRTMLTLVRFVSLDSLSGVYTPLIMNDWTLTLYFAPVFLILSIVLMNLVEAWSVFKKDGLYYGRFGQRKVCKEKK